MVNQRAFTMSVAADAPQHEKSDVVEPAIGHAAPVPDTKGGTNYVDVGVNLDAAPPYDAY